MRNDPLRLPAVAGQFYSSSPAGLREEISALAGASQDKRPAIACLVPHAGYTYSGAVAASTIGQIALGGTVVLLGPNHTGLGAQYSIMAEGNWRTPLGTAEIDAQLAGAILSGSRFLTDDRMAHEREHSLEVEVPLIQYFSPSTKIVPIVLASDEPSELTAIGKEIAAAVKAHHGASGCLIMASSDMTHYEPQEHARRKDKLAIDAILALDEEELVERARRYAITMCGIAPCVTMLAASKMLGAGNARLVKYQTSGDVTGDTRSVVGYAGIIVW